MFAALDKTIGELRSKRARQEKLVNDLTAPVLELERLRDEEARLVAQRAQAEAAVEQLRAERADVAERVERMATYIAEVPAVIATLEKADRGQPRRNPWVIYSQAAAGLRDDLDTYAKNTALLADYDRRLKELAQ